MHFNLGGVEMELRKRWSARMKNHISGGGVMAPVADPFDPSVFYVSDGWGSYYASIRLRKLSVETGEELKNVLTRDCVRCIHVEEDRLFAILNKRILELDRETLEVRQAYKKGVPQHMDFVGFNGVDKLVMMNWMGGFLNIFDLNTEKTQRKKTSNCCGILKETPNSFLVMDGESVLRYNLEKNKFQKLIDVESYTDCAQGTSGALYLLCKGPVADGEISSKVLVYPTATGGEPLEIVPGELVQHIALSQDEKRLALTRDNRFWLYSVPEGRLVFQHEFDGAFVFEDGLRVFDQDTVLTYRWSEKNLTCWSLMEQMP